MRQKEMYAAPETVVLELRPEGTVLTGSPLNATYQRYGDEEGNEIVL